MSVISCPVSILLWGQNAHFPARINFYNVYLIKYPCAYFFFHFFDKSAGICILFYCHESFCSSSLRRQVFSGVSLQILQGEGPYPMVLLPLRGGYWMESSDGFVTSEDDSVNESITSLHPSASELSIDTDFTAQCYRCEFYGKVKHAWMDLAYGWINGWNERMVVE